LTLKNNRIKDLNPPLLNAKSKTKR